MNEEIEKKEEKKMIRKKIKEICKKIRNKKIKFFVEVEMHDWYTYIIYTSDTDKYRIKLRFNKEQEICFNLELEMWKNNSSDGFKQIFLSHQEGKYLYEKFENDIFPNSISKVLKDEEERQEELLNSIKF